MEELEESECNAITGQECCDICGKLIGSEWQINHPSTILCEHCATKELYSEDVGAC